MHSNSPLEESIGAALQESLPASMGSFVLGDMVVAVEVLGGNGSTHFAVLAATDPRRQLALLTRALSHLTTALDGTLEPEGDADVN